MQGYVFTFLYTGAPLVVSRPAGAQICDNSEPRVAALIAVACRRSSNTGIKFHTWRERDNKLSELVEIGLLYFDSSDSMSALVLCVVLCTPTNPDPFGSARAAMVLLTLIVACNNDCALSWVPYLLDSGWNHVQFYSTSVFCTARARWRRVCCGFCIEAQSPRS